MLGNTLWIQFLRLWMLVFYLLEFLVATIWGYHDKEWIIPPHVISSLLSEALKHHFPSLAHQGIYRFYIKSSTWHHISSFLLLFKMMKNAGEFMQILTAWWIILLQWTGVKVRYSIILKVIILQTNIKISHICLI